MSPMRRYAQEQQARPGEPARRVRQRERELPAQQRQAPGRQEPQVQQQREPELPVQQASAQRAPVQRQRVPPARASEQAPELQRGFRRECGACRVSRPPPACYGPG